MLNKLNCIIDPIRRVLKHHIDVEVTLLLVSVVQSWRTKRVVFADAPSEGVRRSGGSTMVTDFNLSA